MKSGSGNLDFGTEDNDEDDDSGAVDRNVSTDEGTTSGEQLETDQPKSSEAASETGTDHSQSQSQSQPTAEAESETDTQDFPYFVRRSNVGDERDQRIEVHLRKEVSDQEADFRTKLADHLDTDEVPKTDAREFALKFAFKNPEYVAELMRDEGFGLID